MSISIKPKIYLSWITNGKIKFIPKIYASIVQAPHVEKVSADTSRNISTNENISADTFRKVGVAENASADLNRRVKNIEKAVADTSRKMGVVFATADSFRSVKNVSIATDDTLRKIGITEKIIADSFRKVAMREKISADIFLQIKKPEKATADTCHCILDRATADTSRKVTRPEKVCADTVFRYPHILNLLAQDNTFRDYGLTLFEVLLNERTLSDSFTLEIAKRIDINDAVKGMFLDYPFSFLVEETTQQDLISTVNGMYDIDKLLYSYVRYQINFPTETIRVSSNSYSGSRIISVHEQGYSQNYTKASDYLKKAAAHFGFSPSIKFTDFTPNNIDNDSDITYRDLISTLFSWTAKLPQRQINVFIRDKTLHCIQRGLEDSVFDISNIPHSRPIVNKKLLRTMYNSPFEKNEITAQSISSKNSTPDSPDTPSTPDDSPVDDDLPVDDEFIEEDIPIPFSGTLHYQDDDEDVSLKYSGGLLAQESSSFKNSERQFSQKTYYKYGEILNYDDWYLISKSVKNTNATEKEKTVTSTKTTYKYISTGEEVYLAKEKEISTTENFRKRDGTWELINNQEEQTRVTYHVPVGNSFYTTSVYVDGEIQGSSISQGKPGNKVSLYTINQVQLSLAPKNNVPATPGSGGKTGSGNSGGGTQGGSSGGNYSKGVYRENANSLSAINDVSFPVCEIELLRELQLAFTWLNRKIQVTVYVDLISKVENGVPDLKHVVDFTERVKLDGEEYFLVSNTVSLTPRDFIQKLQLVRWTD